MQSRVTVPDAPVYTLHPRVIAGLGAESGRFQDIGCRVEGCMVLKSSLHNRATKGPSWMYFRGLFGRFGDVLGAICQFLAQFF